MTIEPVIDAEIVEPLDPEAAERLNERIRLLVGSIHNPLTKLYELVAEAKEGNLHAALGFPSWTAYLADVFSVGVRLSRKQRKEMVGYLSGEGMSQRAIGAVVGVDQKTVSHDLRREENSSPETTETIGVDGKTYRRKTAEIAEQKRRHGNSLFQNRQLEMTQVKLRCMADFLEDNTFPGGGPCGKTLPDPCRPDIGQGDHHRALGRSSG